ncbi:DUF814 domain-containing protein [bacterium]|nr:DUF814 domain-containing protein [bacterium]
MDSQKFIRSWPALWLWMHHLSEALAGTELSAAYTFRKGRLDMHFTSQKASRRLSWEKQGNQALLTLSEQATTPKRRVDLFRNITTSSKVSSVRVHALDRLLRLDFSDGSYLALGFFPALLNIYLFKDNALADSFLKEELSSAISSQWLGPEDQLPADIPGKSMSAAELEKAIAGLTFEPESGNLRVSNDEDSQRYKISELVIEVLKRGQRPKQSPSVSIIKTGKTVLKRWQNKLKKVELELEESEAWPELEIRLQGLQMALGLGLSIQSGIVELESGISPTGTPLSIRIDKGLTLQNSIEATAKKIRKYKGKLILLDELVPSIRADIRSLEVLLEKGDSEAIQSFLRQHGETLDRSGRQQTERTPYKKYQSPGGFDILVGRGSADNDVLTFKVANKNDWWFHVRQIRGSHVILRTGNQAPQQADIFKAAEYAALNSKAKHSGVVVVQYCQRKHLSKPKGSPPGTVLVHHEKSVTIDLDQI